MSFSKIITANGDIDINYKDFSEPTEPMNREVAKKNLLDIKHVLDANDVSFGLIYGTLLGAYREKGFIEHDYDTDLFVLEENKQNLLNSLSLLVKIGFKVCRYDGLILSVIREEEYIDFYFFRKSLFNYRKNGLGLTARAKYLENTVPYEFLGESFQIPIKVETFLVHLYGKNWKKPIKNDPSMGHHWYIIMREFVKKNMSFVFPFLSYIKRFFK